MLKKLEMSLGLPESMAKFALTVFAMLALALFIIPKIQVFGLHQLLHPHTISPNFYKRDVFTQEDRARQTLATIIGGFLVLVGAYVTWRNMRAAERNAEIAQRNIEIAEDKQLTDRFTAAVTNLSAEGDNKMAQRLGGIYALERIAKDSPEDHWTVMEVLTAYIRDKRPMDSTEPTTPVPTDIQAILTAIGRRNAEKDNGNRLELHGVNLSEANLSEANLRNADLTKADLTEANLSEADLTEANLSRANLSRAHLYDTNLSRAYLSIADLSGARLFATNLSGARLFAANLSEANLIKADLSEADLSRTNLTGAYLFGAKNLTQEQLDSANPDGIPAFWPSNLQFQGKPAPEPPPDPLDYLFAKLPPSS